MKKTEESDLPYQKIDQDDMVKSDIRDTSSKSDVLQSTKEPITFVTPPVTVTISSPIIEVTEEATNSHHGTSKIPEELFTTSSPVTPQITLTPQVSEEVIQASFETMDPQQPSNPPITITESSPVPRDISTFTDIPKVTITPFTVTSSTTVTSEVTFTTSETKQLSNPALIVTKPIYLSTTVSSQVISKVTQTPMATFATQKPTNPPPHPSTIATQIVKPPKVISSQGTLNMKNSSKESEKSFLAFPLVMVTIILVLTISVGITVFYYRKTHASPLPRTNLELKERP